ncbi:MAG: hypothetical protein ACI8ZB_003118 [Desulforhopalus sp.]|jgi:hypothetical protein
MNTKDLSNIFEGIHHGSPLDEILYLAQTIAPEFDTELLKEVHRDLNTFFRGTHPDFQENTMPYHNLRHSILVVLASARLFHGLYCNHVRISAATLFKGLLAAYFHDSGMLLLENDPATSGTEYIADHESRSIAFLTKYAKEKRFGTNIISDCATIINYTKLESDPALFAFHTHEIQIAGQVVGSADILAQMADRYYLECLPLLFIEQQAGGINKHNSALALMEHTANFYHNIVLRRLITTFSNTSNALRAHFRERHTINRNLYIDNIDKNIIYLREIIKKCGNIEELKQYLKRTPPAT